MKQGHLVKWDIIVRGFWEGGEEEEEKERKQKWSHSRLSQRERERERASSVTVGKPPETLY